jgi:transcriptional regulator with PAS, ATPase and Fis domain
MCETLVIAARAAADREASILLLGETGVGKGWLARRIHLQSPRRAGPYFELNCASMTRELVESELFGHARGAFTGAEADKRGLVEEADGGTLFLDEIAELPLEVQAHLLTFLDTRRFRPVGGLTTKSVDVRVVAATNCDLEEAIRARRFRPDLFHRLSVCPIAIPSLRQRTEDLPQLAVSLLRELTARRGLSISVDPSAFESLAGYDWPGNVRELRNVLERAIILSNGVIDSFERYLPARVEKSCSVRLEDVMRAHVLGVLDGSGGNRTIAARRLGIGRSTLKRKLREYGLSPEMPEASV